MTPINYLSNFLIHYEKKLWCPTPGIRKRVFDEREMSRMSTKLDIPFRKGSISVSCRFETIWAVHWSRIIVLYEMIWSCSGMSFGLIRERNGRVSEREGCALHGGEVSFAFRNWLDDGIPLFYIYFLNDSCPSWNPCWEKFECIMQYYETTSSCRMFLCCRNIPNIWKFTTGVVPERILLSMW